VAAAASFYGAWLVSDAVESPHLSLGKVKGELYIACAEFDDLAPPAMVAELRTLFMRAGSPGELEIYPGVHHGFAFPQRKVYDKPAAERHWERLIPPEPARAGVKQTADLAFSAGNCSGSVRHRRRCGRRSDWESEWATRAWSYRPPVPGTDGESARPAPCRCRRLSTSAVHGI